MLVLEHDKTYGGETFSTIGNIPELIKTTVKLELDIKNNPIDEIVYILIAAEMKRKSDNFLERKYQAESRFDLAQRLLKEFMKKEYDEK